MPNQTGNCLNECRVYFLKKKSFAPSDTNFNFLCNTIHKKNQIKLQIKNVKKMCQNSSYGSLIVKVAISDSTGLHGMITDPLGNLHINHFVKCHRHKPESVQENVPHKILWAYRAIGLMSRVFANGLGDLGSVPGQVIPKTQKMLLDAALLNIQ